MWLGLIKIEAEYLEVMGCRRGWLAAPRGAGDGVLRGDEQAEQEALLVGLQLARHHRIALLQRALQPALPRWAVVRRARRLLCLRKYRTPPSGACTQCGMYGKGGGPHTASVGSLDNAHGRFSSLLSDEARLATHGDCLAGTCRQVASAASSDISSSEATHANVKAHQQHVCYAQAWL